MKLLGVLMMLLQVSVGPSDPDDNCPVLLTDSGMTWTYHQTQDAGVCYAIEAASGEQAFGVYLGDAPRLDTSLAKAVGGGSVGGHSVTWYELSSGYVFAEPPNFSQETLIEFDHAGRYAHVWVTAASPVQFAQRLAALERIKFR
ncbi:hypothetical protein ACW7GZ_14500 [Luteimonas sp. A537]